MNEQIKQLAEQAWDYADYYGMLSDSKEHEIFTEKFAELIVRECVKLQHKNVVVGGVSDYNRGRRELAEDISKHFGVEE